MNRMRPPVAKDFTALAPNALYTDSNRDGGINSITGVAGALLLAQCQKS